MFEDKFKGDLIKKIKKIITNKPDDNWLNWLEEAISKKFIKYYDYESFKNIQIVGQGHFGKVFRANYKDSEQYFALKSFSNLNALTIKEIVHELKLQREVDYHNNIIRFHGITKNQGQSKSYLLVLEYASDGTLRDYLKKNFDDLSWDQKHDLALQIACAVSCLHNEKILHCDLHPGNILVHQNTIKLSDFGLSKRIEEATNPQSNLHGVIPYVDPKRFENSSYELNEKSDVYSVGVLLWEISSGKPPFHNRPSDEIALTITQGNREEPVSDPNIPSDYVKLYEECWDGEPDNRPNMEQVTSRLREMLTKNDDQTNDDQTDDVLLSYIQNPNSSNNLPMSSYFNHVPSRELREAFDNEAIEIDHNNEQKMIDDIIDFMWRKTNEGRESRLKVHVSNIIKNNSQRILNWLSSNNQNNLNCNFLLGYFHYKGIGMDEENKVKAFELFHNAENQDHDLTIYYLGICYQYGYGTTKDENSAFNCFFKLSQKDIAAGQSRTGHCYAKGIGVKHDKKLAVDFYEKAANNGNLAAKYNLGNCYLVGKLVDKDVEKGFELIQQTAEIEFSLNGITMLGFCYHNGIGTQEDKEAAFKLYKRAANLGDKIAQYNLAQMYEKEDNTMKDIDNAIRWYKKSGYKDSEKRAKKLLKIKVQDFFDN